MMDVARKNLCTESPVWSILKEFGARIELGDLHIEQNDNNSLVPYHQDIMKIVKTAILGPSVRHLRDGSEIFEEETNLIVNSAFKLISYLYSQSTGTLSDQSSLSSYEVFTLSKEHNDIFMSNLLLIMKMATLWPFLELKTIRDAAIDVVVNILNGLMKYASSTSKTAKKMDYVIIVSRIFDAIEEVSNVAHSLPKMVDMKRMTSLKPDENAIKVFLTRSDQLIGKFKDNEDIRTSIINGNICILSSSQAHAFVKAGLKVISCQCRNAIGITQTIISRVIRFISDKLIQYVNNQTLSTGSDCYLEEMLDVLVGISKKEFISGYNYINLVIVYLIRSISLLIKKSLLSPSLENRYECCITSSIKRLQVTEVLNSALTNLVDSTLLGKIKSISLKKALLSLYLPHVEKFGMPFETMSEMFQLYYNEYVYELQYAIVECMKGLGQYEVDNGQYEYEVDKHFQLAAIFNPHHTLRDKLSEIVAITLNMPLQDLVANSRRLSIIHELSCYIAIDDGQIYKSIYSNYSIMTKCVIVWIKEASESADNIESVVKAAAYMSSILVKMKPSEDKETAILECIWMISAALLKERHGDSTENNLVTPNSISTVVFEHPQLVKVLSNTTSNYLWSNIDTIQACTSGLCELQRGISVNVGRKYPLQSLIAISFYRLSVNGLDKEASSSSMLGIVTRSFDSVKRSLHTSPMILVELLSALLNNFCRINCSVEAGRFIMNAIESSLCTISNCNIFEKSAASSVEHYEIRSTSEAIPTEKIGVLLSILEGSGHIKYLHKEFTSLMRGLIRHGYSTVLKDKHLLDFTLKSILSLQTKTEIDACSKLVSEYVYYSIIHESKPEEQYTVDESDNPTITNTTRYILEWLELQDREVKVHKIMDVICIIAELKHVANESIMMRLLTLVVRSIPSSGYVERYTALESFRRICILYTNEKFKVISLLGPVLRDLDIMLVMKLVCNQETLKYMSTCLQVSAKILADGIISYVIPKLVVSRDTESIKSIEVISNESTPALIISHLAAILTEIFLRHGLEYKDSLNYVMHKCGVFQLNILLRSSLLLLVTLLSVELGSTIEDNRTNALNSLYYLQEMFSTSSINENSLNSFMDKYFTGILSYISSKLFSLNCGGVCVKEARKMTRSVNEIIKIMNSQQVAYSPQIMVIINGACEMREVSDLGLECISTLINKLERDQLLEVLPDILSAVCVNYKEFHLKDKNSAQSIIQTILSNKDIVSALKLENIKIFLASEAFKGFEHMFDISNTCSSTNNNEIISQIITILDSSKSSAIVEDNLKLLKRIMKSKIHNIKCIHETTDINDIIQYLYLCVKVICKICHKFSRESELIGTLSCECLGIIGAIDFTTVIDFKPSTLKEYETDIKRGPFDINSEILNPLDSQEMLVRFSFHLISNIIGPAYINATDAKHQVYLAHAIQELMMLCGLTKNMVYKLQNESVNNQQPQRKRIKTSRTNQHHNDELANSRSVCCILDDNKIKNMWHNMPKQLTNKLAPLVESSFSVIAQPQKRLESPLFPTSESFLEWINVWAVSLVKKTSNPYTRPIFLSMNHSIGIIPVEETQKLLIHMCLDIIVFGKEEAVQGLKKEIYSVFEATQSAAEKTRSSSFDVTKYKLVCNTIFGIIDSLTCWTRKTRRSLITGEDEHYEKHNATSLKSYCECVESFLEGIDFECAGHAATVCKKYAQGIVYLENHIRTVKKQGKKKCLGKVYSQLQQIYFAAKKEDYVEGLCQKINEITLDQEALRFENSKDWSSAQMCYENMLQMNDIDYEPQLGIMMCLKNVGQLKTLLMYSMCAVKRVSNRGSDIKLITVEAAWRLGEWSVLQSSIENNNIPETFEKKLAHLLLAMYKNDYSRENIVNLRSLSSSMKKLLAEEVCNMPEETLYMNHNTGYQIMQQMHALSNIDDVITMGETDLNIRMLNDMVTFWRQRLRRTAPSFRNKELNLYLNKSLFMILKSHLLKRYKLNAQEERELSSIEGMLWIDIAKNARKSGYYQTALSAILHAQVFKIPEVYVERAKLMWAQNKNYDAISILEMHSDNTYDLDDIYNISGHTDKHVMNIKAKAQLHLTHWKEVTSSDRTEYIIESYTQIKKNAPNWEKALLYMGRYYNKLYQNHYMKNKRNQESFVELIELANNVCTHYSKVLSLSDKYYYETMPRLLTLWLNHGGELAAFSKDARNAAEYKNFTELNKIIISISKDFPVYKFLYAVPQLVSRIDHKNHEVYPVILEILVKLLLTYPHQVLWGIIATYRSSSKDRAARIKQVLDMVIARCSKDKKYNSNITLLINQTIRVADMLIKLCNMSVKSSVSTVDLNSFFPAMSTIESLDLIVPLQLSISGDSSNTSVFIPNSSSSEYPSIAKFQPRVEVISSLQRPKKLQVLGSDGKIYTFLCKPKDDLRKDYRLMGFNSMVNKLLKKDPESRKRKLFIKTYAVTPLDDECGLIEWVPNTTSFRKIMIDSYRSIGAYITQIQVMELLNDRSHTLKENFSNVLSRFPPIFHGWFLEQFPDPERWFSSRYTYSSSTAVMSIVGYIVGLGDRHGENILLDQQTGSIMHVDFNCLFEKGKTFEKPECVPFRLTHNMVDAFGPTGVDGVFRKCCEISLKTCRENTEALTSVLETFIHEPLCDWKKGSKGLRQSNKGVIHNNWKYLEYPYNISSMSIPLHEEPLGQHHATAILSMIKKKLEGFVTASLSASLPLGINGQVHDLIEQATSIENLSRMYIGKKS